MKTRAQWLCFCLVLYPLLASAQESEEEASSQPVELPSSLLANEPTTKEEDKKKKNKKDEEVSHLRYEESNGFIVGDKRNSLRLDASAQLIATNDEDDVAPQEVGIVPRRLRPALYGEVANRVDFKLSIELTALINESLGLGEGNEFLLKDARIDVELWKDGPFLRLGHFKVPFGRQRLTSGTNLLLPRRAQASNQFTFDRGLGLLFGWEEKDERYIYELGLTADVQLASLLGTNPVPILASRFTFNPFGKLSDEANALKKVKTTNLSFGVNVALPLRNNEGFVNDTNDTGNPTVGVDAALETGRLVAQAEIFGRLRQIEVEIDEVAFETGNVQPQLGAYGQLGFLLLPKRLQLATRAGIVGADPNLNDKLNTQGTKTELSVGANLFFLERRFMAQAMFSQFFEVDDDPSSIFTLQIQGAL